MPAFIPARRLVCAAIASLAAVAAAPVMAQATYPSKPITLLVPFPPGSATDAMMRAMAPALSKAMGQQVIIDNRPGASGTMAAAMMAQSNQPDGYQFAVAPATLFKVPHMQKVPYNPMTDLTYVVAFASYTFGLVVPGDAPYKTLAEFIAAAKAAGKPLDIATTGAGSSGHASTVLLAKNAGIQLQSVPFKGGSEVLQAFVGGHVQGVLDGGWVQAVRQGKGRALVTFSEERVMPDVPTARELGINVVSYSPIGLVAPKGMDPQIVKKMQDAVKTATQDAAFKKALATYDLGDTYMTADAYKKVAGRLWVDEKKNLEMLGLLESK